ncbi:MAG: PAS domain S-box protein [Desulfobacterales bacterium]|nr:PAS domain S-box protein [Desulfobacterales bacterium]
MDLTKLTKAQLIDRIKALQRPARELKLGAEGHASGNTGATGPDTCEDEKLRVAELERYRDFVESIEDGCFETDLDGTLTFINQAMCRIHGYPFEKLLGMNHRDFAPPQEVKSIYTAFHRIYQTGIPSSIFDYAIQLPDGSLRHVEVSAALMRDARGKALGFRGITRDRTDKKQRERELQRYRDFMENVGDACYEVNLRGDMTFCNAAAFRTFGYPPEKFLGMNNRDYTSPETAKRIYAIFNRIYRTGQPAKVNDYEIRQESGQVRYLDMNVDLIRDPAGRPVGFRGICRDITERKAAEAETERLNTLLNQAQRLEAIGTLAAGVAHNFNNLLMSIQGCVSLILMGIDSGHPHYERLKAIEGHIKRGADLTVQLLGYASDGRRSVQAAQINQIVGSAAALFGRTQPEVRIFQKYAESPWSVDVDRQQMEHVFMNLFVNAGQAMKDGGSLYIETENVLLDEAFVQAFDRKPGRYVKITVADTGIGMDATTRERIFEPFFSTQNFSRGAGLGLASVYGVVKSHEGIITVQSEKGRGATFTIFLPAAKPKSVSKADSPPPKAEGAPKTILIVDDERVIVDVTSKIVAGLGYEAMIALGGKEAVEIFSANPGRIDLVIMDMVMPGIGGDQAVEMMRAIDPEIKVIMVSGYLESGGSKGVTHRQGGAFLQKPFRVDELSRTIRELLGA